MMRHVVVAIVVLLPAAALSQARGVQGVVDALRAQGYSDVEVSRPQAGRITVEARRAGSERELVYDASTGRLLSDQSHRNDHAGTATAGHEAGDDHGGSAAGHDAGDDHGGSAASHDAGDDHGGASGSSGGGASGGASGGHGSDDRGGGGDHSGGDD
jgi:hypothetical protein